MAQKYVVVERKHRLDCKRNTAADIGRTQTVISAGEACRTLAVDYKCWKQMSPGGRSKEEVWTVIGNFIVTSQFHSIQQQCTTIKYDRKYS